MTGGERPWYRWRNIVLVVCAFVVLGLIWAFLETLAVYRAKPNPTMDARAALRQLFERNAGVPAAQAEAVWPELVAAFEIVDEVAEEINARYAAGEFTPRDEYDWELDYDRVFEGRTLSADLEPEHLAVGVLRQRGVFDRLRSLSERGPALRPLPSGGLLSMVDIVDAPASARQLARASCASMRLAAADGEWGEAMKAFDGVLALSRTIALQPYLIYYLTGVAIEGLALEEMSYGLAEFDADAATCSRFLETVERHNAAFPAVEHPLEVERLYILDWVQWWYSDDGDGDGYLVAAPVMEQGRVVPGEQSFVAAFSSRFFFGSRREIVEQTKDLFDRLIEISRTRPADRLEALEVEGKRIDRLGNRYLVLQLLLGALDRFVEGEGMQGLRRRGAWTIAALETYRARHGRYPDALGQLVPDILAEPPVDPLHGLSLGYRLVTDDPHGRGYFLYSFGLDRQDDGGREPGLDQWAGAVTDPELEGFDFVLNNPRSGTGPSCP